MTLQRRIVRPVVDRVSPFWRGIPGVPRPTLDLDFAAGRVPKGTWTFARGSDGTTSDTAGALQTAGSDGARVRHDNNGKCLGIVLEGARTNKCTNYNASPDPSLTNVTKSGDAAATLTRVDDAAALAAAGLGSLCASGLAFRLDNRAGAANAFATVAGAVGNTNAHALSIWARLAAGAGDLRLETTTGVQAFAGDSYARYALENKTPANASERLAVRAAAGGDVLFVLNQLEEGTFATSEIVTQGAAAARQADSLEIGPSRTAWAEPGGTVLVELAFARDTSGGIGWGSAQSNFHYVSFPQPGTHMRWKADNVNQVTGAGAATVPSFPAVFRYAVSFSATVHRASLDGQTDRDDTGAYVMVAAPTLHLDHAASFGADGDSPLNAHLRRFIYWPEVFDLDTLNTLTAPTAA